MWFRAASLSSAAKRTVIPSDHAFRHTLSSQRPLVSSQASRIVGIARELQGRAEVDDPLSIIASAGRGSRSITAYVRKLAELELDATARNVLNAPTVQDITHCTALQDSSLSSQGTDTRLPSWLVLYVLYHRAYSPLDVVSSIGLIRLYLSLHDIPTSDSVIVLTVAELASKKLTATMREFVQKFCEATHIPSKLHFNLLLRALSLHPRSKENGLLVSQVFERMARHGIKVHGQTYNALLSRSFATLEVAAAVKKKMAQDGAIPAKKQSQYLLQFTVAHRFRGKAARHLKRLQLRWGAKSRPETATVKRLQARFIRSFRRAIPALRYLTGLVAPLDGQTHGMPKVKLAAVDIHHWVAALYVASRDKEIPAETLLSTFRTSAAAYPPNRAAYSAVIRGLMAKHSYGDAALMWDEACSRNVPLDANFVGLGVRALTMNGQPDRAFQLLEDVHVQRSAAAVAVRRRSPEVELHVLHQFMVPLHRMGRPDVVFALFDHMETLYGLFPDVYSINIMLQTAKWARKFEDTIRGQLASLGLGRSSDFASSQTESPGDTRAQPASRISSMLNPARRPWVTGRWNSQPAGRVALSHVVQVFLGNWPELASVPSPVQALRRGSEDAALKPVSEAINRVVESPLYEKSPLLSMLSEGPRTLYLSVMPTDVTFRAFIELLAAESLQTEIPLALAWMRALKIQPSKATLATALAHWVAVSMDSPFIERMKGKSRRDPFSLLMQWMEDWVGVGHMPGREEMAAEMRRAAYYRDVNYLDIIKERNRAAAERRALR